MRDALARLLPDCMSGEDGMASDFEIGSNSRVLVRVSALQSRCTQKPSCTSLTDILPRSRNDASLP